MNNKNEIVCGFVLSHCKRVEYKGCCRLPLVEKLCEVYEGGTSSDDILDQYEEYLTDIEISEFIRYILPDSMKMPLKHRSKVIMKE